MTNSSHTGRTSQDDFDTDAQINVSSYSSSRRSNGNHTSDRGNQSSLRTSWIIQNVFLSGTVSFIAVLIMCVASMGLIQESKEFQNVLSFSGPRMKEFAQSKSQLLVRESSENPRVAAYLITFLMSLTYIFSFAFLSFAANVLFPARKSFESSTNRRKTNAILRGCDDLEDADEEDGVWCLNTSNPACTNTWSELSGHLQGRCTWTFVSKDKTDCSQEEIDFTRTFDRRKNPNASDWVFRKAFVKKGLTRDQNPKEYEHDYEKWEHFLNGNSEFSDREKLAKEAAKAAVHGSRHFSHIQTDEGFWPGDYGGPMFLLPGLVISSYVCGIELTKPRRQAMIRYLRNHQQQDGGWGTHIEGCSTMFGSTLNYIALRLLGVDAQDDAAVRGRVFLHSHGGAVSAPQWAKLWMAVLGVFDWKGCNPTPAELWMLPDWFPFHPGRLWCHCRMVYLPMSYLNSARTTYEFAETDPVILSLRRELYSHCTYENMDWANERETINPGDVFYPQTKLMTFLNWFLYRTLELPLLRRILAFPLNNLRKAALDFTLEYMEAEDSQTNYVDIGPVNKVLNMVCMYDAYGSNSEKFKRHIPRLADYLWVSEDGMKMQGYNGSQFWDTAFAAHGVAYSLQAGINLNVISQTEKVELHNCLQRSMNYVDKSQVRKDEKNKDRYYRHASKGGWPFSTNDHGWPITDCTSEGVKTSLLVERTIHDFGLHAKSSKTSESSHGPIGNRILTQDRLRESIDLVISMENGGAAGTPVRGEAGDGGWASYEQKRGWSWFEALNPAQVFGDIMIDYSYVECTSACLTALAHYEHEFPDDSRCMKGGPVDRGIEAGRQCILSLQRNDGSWYGSWACCFTYAAWFGIEALNACVQRRPKFDTSDKSKEDVTSMEACVNFLLTKQRKDGGWGESIQACADRVYVENTREGSQVVNTSWAIIAIVRFAQSLNHLGIACPQLLSQRLDRAVIFLLSRMQKNGDFRQESVSGVFNKSCSISYTNYRNSFTVWALAIYADWTHKINLSQ